MSDAKESNEDLEKGANAGTEGEPYRGKDRRNKPTPFLSKYSFVGGKRLTGGRRPGENREVFIDRYPLWTWILLTAFLMLNLLDAHFTLIYLQRGGEEANPVAVRLLYAGMGTFIGVKAIGVGLGAMVFCILNNFRNARIGVAIALCFYQLLLLYHMSLYYGWVGNVIS
ncbi:MAG: DUF5658 family protein [Planctomycetota bacterium]